MSQETKKRSRKSKLTPRECDIEVDNIADFQETTEEIQNTAKQKTVDPQTCDDFEALIDSQKKPKEDSQQIEFSVTVAVEQYDEDSSDLIIIENQEETVVIPSDSDENEDACTNINANTKEYELDLPGTLNGELILNRNEILSAANDILEESTNIADKKLSIEVRNCVGQFRVSFEDEFEGKIQNVLLSWLAWQKSITAKWRTTPLCYKCYICEEAWWHLHDFKQHLKKHDDFKLDLEDYSNCEVNIVAYKNVSDIKGTDFNIIGACPKCGYLFERHKLINRDNNSSYSCSVDTCKNFFLTCLLLKTHEEMFHTSSELTGELLEVGKRIYCKVCSFLFYTQKSYESHLNLRHTVRSDLVMPVKFSVCYACKEDVIVGKYHICFETKLRAMCIYCFRSFPRGSQFRLHLEQGQPVKCELCDEVIKKQCIEVLHLMKHTDKFVIMKKCSVCTDFVLFTDYQNAFDHISQQHTHITMRYEGSNYKYISNILLPKSCLQPYLEPKVEIKVEPQDCIIVPESEIKQEIIDNSNADDIDENVHIKDEIEIHDNFEHYKETRENRDDVSRIFGIKIDQTEMDVKKEISDEESEYEDDIIKLDFNFLNNMQESMDTSSQDQKMEITAEEIDEYSIIEEDHEKEDNSDQDYVKEKRKQRLPKIYRCSKCGFDAIHKLYRAHLKSHCTVKEIQKKNYRCTKCSSSFDTFVKYLDHFSTHNLGPLCCPECYKSYDTHDALESHVTSHINMTFVTVAKTKHSFYYTCNICNGTVEKSQFFDHWETHLSTVERKKESIYKGVNCGRSCELNDDMLAELLERLQSPAPFYIMKRGCPICLRYFERKNDYKRHLVEHLLNHAYSQHHIHKQLKCEICSQGFQKADNFKKHMRDHGYLRDYKCQICEKSFSDSSNYSKHIKLHNKNAYTCDICKKRFQAKASLEKHIMLHNVQQPIHCVPCKKFFFIESAYKKHYRVTHENADRKYVCQFCRQRFSSLKEKWDHLWYVHKERKHKIDCPKCPNSYRKFSDLKNHMKIVHCKTISKKYYKRITKKIEDAETLYVY